MRAPTSYAGPRRSNGVKEPMKSQSLQTNTPIDNATVGTLLSKKGGQIYAVRMEDSMLKAVDMLREKRIGALLVTSPDGALEGILSERDIVRKLSVTPGEVLKQKVEMLMTRKVVVCAPEDSLDDVLRRMTEGRFRHMPVMDEGKLAGIVTIGDVVHFRLDQLEHEALQLKQIIVG